ncbi:glycerophosphodiester phosphodiesterase [Halobellus rubicundus]|uniref:Glycerophosphodiester phosphodiesterase n=1 Tax=Halobellus rubicundus TaxID=2996466 RepID=A0ABD5MFX7_9EURY
MRPIAHRGCPAQYPENTLEAFRNSAPAVDMIETDVRRCGSGELVLFHDETLDRVTDATGVVAETPLSELREASVLGTGEQIPLLRELFEVVPSAVGLNLELKARDVAREVTEAAADHDHDVLVSSFHPSDLAAAAEAGAETALLLPSEETTPAEFDVGAALDVAAEHACSSVHPHVSLCLETDIVADAHARGFDVNAWTATSASEIERLRDRGVDGVVIDDCEHAALCRDA